MLGPCLESSTGAIRKFRGRPLREILDGTSKTFLPVGFVDRETSKAAAGHLCYAVLPSDPPQVQLLDGKPLGSHRSEGFAHPMKRWFSLLMNPSAWIDDVKVYKVK